MLPVALSHQAGARTDRSHRPTSLVVKKGKVPLTARYIRCGLLLTVSYLLHHSWSLLESFPVDDVQVDRLLSEEDTVALDEAITKKEDAHHLTTDVFGLSIDQVTDRAFLDVLEARQRDGWQGPPSWITDYFTWHRETREAYEDLKNPDNLPPLLVNYCKGSGCGGLHDRLGSLPFDLYMANQTKRLLVYVWEQPALEEFLVPPSGVGGIDWTFPHTHLVQNATDIMILGTKDYYWEGHAAFQPFWAKHVPNAIAAATTTTKDGAAPPNLVTLKARGHAGEFYLEDILRSLNETDMIHLTPTFGWLWRALFQPSVGLSRYLERMTSSMSLTRPYAAVHCRVHYPDLIRGKFNPKARRYRLKTVDEPTSKADAARKDPDWNGLKMEGLGKKFAVNVGLHALQCASQLVSDHKNTQNSSQQAEEAASAPQLYLFSDSNGMVEYLTRNVTELLSTTTEETSSTELDQTDEQALSVIQSMKNHVVARPDISNRNYHLDLPDAEVRKSLDPQVFYATFGDLYLALGAECISFGYGGFGRFAQQLNNNPCYVQHQLHIMEVYRGHALQMRENLCEKTNTSVSVSER